MKETARVVTGPTPSAEDEKIARLLEFFGVSYATCTVAEFLAEDHSQHRVLCSSEVFGQLLESCDAMHSAFVYASGNADGLLERLAPEHASIGGVAQWLVSESEFADVLREKFVRRSHRGAPVFLSFAGQIIDVAAQLETANFDVREHALSTIPIVVYVRWAFRRTAWHAPEVNACLVIDDPLLKPRYGFVAFRELLALMERHRFATSIAFIPWNWRRSDPGVVRLFQQNSARLSICVHGCDHTAGEFGGDDAARVGSLAAEASERMSAHENKTGLVHDRVMVFPQGVFSDAAIAALKRTGFVAAVNTEVVAAQSNPPPITIGDVWDGALMRYASFPIYTRRYPRQGVANFAFDILLGKPCIVVIHHDFCCDRCAALTKFIDGLNHLNCPLQWRPIGDLVKRSCRQREVSSGEIEVEMYGAELELENRQPQRTRFLIRRAESEPGTIKQVLVRSEPVDWVVQDKHLTLQVELEANERATIRLEFHPLVRNNHRRVSPTYRAKTSLRRYLSEIRDNYVVPAKARLTGSR